MNKEDFKERTKQFALRCVDLALALPENDLGRVIRRQLLRCGTSVGANYRAACRAKSQADFIAKLGIVEEEADECLFWMEMIGERKLLLRERSEKLYSEGDQILAMVCSSIKTAKKNYVREGAPDWQAAEVAVGVG